MLLLRQVVSLLKCIVCFISLSLYNVSVPLLVTVLQDKLVHLHEQAYPTVLHGTGM